MGSVDLTERTLGEFRVMRKLGGGGMADVYLAEQQSLGRHVALKVMRPSLMSGSDDTMVKRFKMEAMTAAGLNHANIVQVYTIGHEQNFHYIAQEYVQGKNLAQLLKAKGKADIGSTLHIMRQIASALKAAGKAGIIHRDIKPENIMLTKRGEVKITDFGLAQLAEKKTDGSLTEDGMTLGTPLYMSPEQVRGAELDVRSDIYSFGVTCYHMLTGAPPFQGDTAMAIAIQHVNNTAEDIQERNPKVPTPIARMVHRMMARDRDLRYPDAEQIAEDVRKLVTAKKQGQDLNLVRLPCLAELELMDPNSVPMVTGKTVTSKKTTKAKGKSKGTGSRKLPVPAKPTKATKKAASKIPLGATAVLPVPAPIDEVIGQPQAPMRQRDEEEEEDFPGREAKEVEELDMTPMIDVTFLLLIFFMITASFTLQKSMSVPPPEPDDGASTQPMTDEMQQESIEIRIDQNNTILVEGQECESFDDVVGAIEQKMGEEGKTAILLEAEPESTHGKSILVFDAAQAAKVQKIRQKLPSSS
ncbi:MAG: protein kinase [Planctomycetaceae bacterium]